MAREYDDYEDVDEYDEEEGEAYEPQGERSPMAAMLANSPWWLISLAVHLVVILLAAVIVLSTAKELPKPKVVTTELDDEEEEEYDPEIQRTIEKQETPQEEITEVTEETEIVEDVVNEDPTEQDLESLSPSDSESVSDVPFPSSGASALGMGGGKIGGGGRGGMGGRRRRRAGGGGGKSESAVEAGLRWLKRHQSDHGGWKAKEFHERCNKDPDFPGTCENVNGGEDTGWETTDVGISGMSLLAYLGAGYTHTSGIYKNTVKGALKYALDMQQPDGAFGSQVEHQGNYNHSCMTMAIAEAYGMTMFSRLKEPAQKAIDYIAKSRNDGLAWRYGIKPGENDTSVTGWMVLALKSSKLASGLHVDQGCFDGAAAWYDIATDPAYGKVGYMTRGGQQSRLPDKTHFATNEALTSVAMIARLFMGVDRSNTALKLGADRIVQDPPTWEPETKIDMYYWYYASLAIFQMGSPYWDKWQEPMKNTIVDNQRQGKRACEDGSWDPIGAWGGAGGRVYATAINVLTLEVYYRYDFIKGNK